MLEAQKKSWMLAGSPYSEVCPRPLPKENGVANDGNISGRYFRLNENEVKTLNEDSELPDLSPWNRNGEGQYFAGIDMLHSLHCLNALRKHLEPGFKDNVAKIAPEMRQLHLGEIYFTLRLRNMS